MRTVNKVILIGNIAKDPLIRETKVGAKNALFVVATNRIYKDKNGQVQNEAEFSNCIAWGMLADRCQQYLKKGKLVYIEGRLKTRTIEKEDGTKIYRTEIVVLNLIFLNKRGEFSEEATPVSDTSPILEVASTDSSIVDLDIDDSF